MTMRSWILSLAALLVLNASAASQELPVLSPSDYGQFENLGAFSLDPTGEWLVASIRRVDESVELRLLRSDGSGDDLILEHGSGPVFSPDGRWLAYRKGVSTDEREASEGPVRDRLGLVDLQAGTDSVLFPVRSFSFRDDGAWLAALGHPAADTIGADLIVFDPQGGGQTLIGNVEEFAWQDGGDLLAATLRTAWGSANGVLVFDAEAGTMRTLDSRNARYRSLTWDDGSARLAVLRSVEVEGREDESHDVLVWDDVSSPAAPRLLAATERADVPGDMRITEYDGIEFDASGRTVFVGVRPWPIAEEETAENDEAAGDDTAEDDADGMSTDESDDEAEVGPADVQVWHWDDDQILRAQEYNASRISRQTHAAAWHLGSDDFVVLGQELDEPVQIIEDGRWGLVPDHDPYLFERRFGDGSADWYRVDLRTGTREPIVTGAAFGVEAGPADGSVQLFHDARWWSVDLESLEMMPLTDDAGFERSLADYDYPGARPSWGLGAWTPDGDAFLYDKFDVYRADPAGGTPVRLTNGAAEGLQYRVLRMDPDLSFFDPNVLEAGAPIWLSVRNVRTKASGFARLDGTEVETLVMEDASVGSLRRASDSDRFAWRTERWDDSPNVITGDGDLDGAREVLDTNPFQADFSWGHSELVEYTTDAGHDLQGILVYPADFEPGREYPLILYQYERLSDGLHRYNTPSERSYYNYQVWSQEGYFVLMPDILYEPGRPGPSALDAVEHALDAAVATGHVDPERMGLIGHSWGGYQASYLPTRTDRFAASVAGAAITNFLSFMGAVHWNGGLPETGHWETGQARMASPYWEDLAGHLESSPANYIQDLDTPMLLMHGDADGVVDFRQGLEFYNYARRAGKEVVLLVYPGADHGLREEKQQVDYHRRILEWFDHYLKGDDPASWIIDGEDWVTRGKRIGG